MEGVLSQDATRTAGILLLTVVAVQSGGLYMLRIVRGRQPVTDFQLAFARAGHAHAGVLVILSLIIQIYADAAGMSGLLAIAARSGVPAAAILMPAGMEGYYKGLEVLAEGQSERRLVGGGQDLEQLVTVAARYGIEITGPMPEVRTKNDEREEN
jgi:hypothetical protein